VRLDLDIPLAPPRIIEQSYTQPLGGWPGGCARQLRRTHDINAAECALHENVNGKQKACL